MKRTFALLFLVIGCASLAFGQASSPRKIPMIFGDYPPYYIVQKDAAGKTTGFTGMYMDFLKEFEKRYPYKIVPLTDLPRIRMDMAMENGEAVAFSLNNPMFVRNPRDYLWSDSIFHTKDVVISPQDKPIKYQKPEDLFGKRIAKVLGNGYGDLDKYFASKQIIANDLSGADLLQRSLKLLDSGWVDAMFGNSDVSPYQMKKLGVDPENYYWSEKPLFEFDLQCEISKSEAQFQKDLNAFIATAKEEGLIEKIRDRWLR